MNKFMVEGFDSASDISQASYLSDLALDSYLAENSNSGVITANLQNTSAKVLTEKNKAATSLSEDIAEADTNLVSTAYYLSRSKDLINLATDVKGIATGQVTAVSTNQKLSSRQNEINEWSNYNKLEILYFMQIVFISLSLFSLLAYLYSISYISSSLFWTIVSSVSIVDLLIILLKARFTLMNRDGRYWHKMRFANQPHVNSGSSNSKCS